jgi:hypothetical protein
MMARHANTEAYSLPTYQYHTKAADTLIAVGYLAGTTTGRVRRVIRAVFVGAVDNDR